MPRDLEEFSFLYVALRTGERGLRNKTNKIRKDIMNREEILDKYEEKYEKNRKKSRKRSSKALIWYIILSLLTVYIIIKNGFSMARLAILLSLGFCIFVSIRNRKILKKEEVTFATEYLEDKKQDEEITDNGEVYVLDEDYNEE